MSFHAIHWAQRVPAPLSSNEAFVLVTLAEYANDDGSSCRPSMSTVARKCRMSRATVYRILDRLEYVHQLIVKERSGQRGGKPNHYRLLVNERANWPAERTAGSALDPVVPGVPTLFDPEGGVSPRDTPTAEVIPMVSRQARQGGVSPRDTPVSRHATGGVAPGATGGVAPGATQPFNYPLNTHQRACDGLHVVDNELVNCGTGVPGCTMFVVADDTAARGQQAIAELRQRLLSKSGGS